MYSNGKMSKAYCLSVCHTEWSKSEREEQIPYANAHVWNLKNGTYEPMAGQE